MSLLKKNQGGSFHQGDEEFLEIKGQMHIWRTKRNQTLQSAAFLEKEGHLVQLYTSFLWGFKLFFFLKKLPQKHALWNTLNRMKM